MASLCTVASVSATAQHVNFKATVQVPAQSQGTPHYTHSRKLVCHYHGLVSSKQFAGGCCNYTRRHVGSRKHKCVTTCVVTTAVVEQDTEQKTTSNSSSVNPKAGLKSPDSPSLSGDDDSGQLLPKPAPKPVAIPRPQPRPRSSPPSNTTPTSRRWTPRNNGAKPGNRTPTANGSSESKNPIDSLGQILEKAEKLREQSVIAQKDKETRYAKSTWRKGVGLETPPPNGASGVDGSSPISIAQFDSKKLDVKQPELQGPPRKGPAKPAINRDVSQSPRKPVILRDIGRKDQPRAGKQGAVVSRKLGSETVNTAVDVLGTPTKTGKPGALKSKDNKDNWRKKSMSSGEGLKRRIGPKGNDADDVVDSELAGASGSTRRGGRKMTKASRRAARMEAARAAAPVKVDILEVGEQGISVPDLAQKLAVNDAEIVKTLFMKGIATTVNQTLDEETVKLVCQEFNVEVVEAGSLKVEEMAKKTEFLDEDDLENLHVRPPVVTIMGHVDHGKTSLLDFIRKSKVAASEAGGITQGIGAYSVPVTVDGREQSCVFLDTPGHEAFTAMRARGARVTDIAIIVVAADDGVRPQTQEAIAHAKAANVPIIVAINKIDKEGAEPERVMQELAGIGLMPEEWGGDVPMVQISAIKGLNVDSLLETVMLVAEFQDLRANPERSAKGTVIESCLDKTKGVLATLLVQNGTLNKGDVVLCGEAYGKVRALLDDTGERISSAGPSTAVQVYGLSSVPNAGDVFEVLDSLDIARERAEECSQQARLTRLAAQAAEGKVTLASLANTFSEGTDGGVERHQLNVILKVDVQGTLEAVRQALNTLPQDTVNLRMLMQAAGDVTISDVDLAIASEAIIMGFNVGAASTVQSYADNKGVEIRLYRVIYELIDDIRNAMEGLLDIVQEQVPIGTAEVRAVFSSGSGKVAGCMVTDGKLLKGCGCKVIRSGEVVHTGNVFSLRRVKENVKEVVAGLECGVGVEGYNDWQAGDFIEAFNSVSKKRTLEEASISTASSLAAVAAGNVNGS